MDWEVGCIAAVDTPEHRAGYRWFVVPTFPRVPIFYTETREEAKAIVEALRRRRLNTETREETKAIVQAVRRRRLNARPERPRIGFWPRW
jgi:hypothetical protein